MTLLRHPRLLAFVHRLAHRGDKAVACWVCAWVWRDLEAMPGFNEGMARAKADMEAGRSTRYRVTDGELVQETK